MKLSICSLALMAVAILISAPAANAVDLVFDENVIPTNPINGFGSFTFDDFGGAAVTDGPSSLILDVTDSNASNGVFGGIGVDFVVEDPPSSGIFVPQDFVAAAHEWEVRLRLLPNNAATSLRLSVQDDDGAGTADEHVYAIDLTAVPNDGQFHIVTIPFDTPLFTQGAFGFTPGNGIVDPGLRQIQLQSEFGSTGRLHVEVDYARIIPEPTSLCLAAYGLAAATVFPRRQRK